MKDEENENREQETVFNNQCSTCNLATFAPGLTKWPS